MKVAYHFYIPFTSSNKQNQEDLPTDSTLLNSSFINFKKIIFNVLKMQTIIK